MTKGKGDRMDVILAYDADMPCAASLDAIIDDLDIDDTALALDQMVRTPDNKYRVCGWKNIEWDGSPLCAALSPVLRYYRHTLVGVEDGRVVLDEAKISDDYGTDEVFSDSLAAFDEDTGLFYSEYTDGLDDF